MSKEHVQVENIYRFVTEHCEYTLYPNPDAQGGWEGGGYLKMVDRGVTEPETIQVFLEPEALRPLHQILGKAADEAGA